jgi:selenocysteine lyase/cysteine desulfurase
VIDFDGIHRELYPAAARSAYLDTAAVGIISRPVRQAMDAVTEDHLLFGGAHWDARAAVISGARGTLARLIGGRGDHVAFTQNTSTGLAIVANGIDWRAGDGLVVPAGEFPSNFYPWTRLRRRGVEVRAVQMRQGHAETADIRARIDGSTRVLALSAVQYSSGFRYDLEELGRLCRDAGVLFVVDGTQAVGALDVNAGRADIDVLAVSAHKWMLGPTGVGFVHLSRRALEMLQPSTVGWLSVDDPFAFDREPRLAPDARRFESGTENAAGIAGMAAAADLVLSAGVQVVESRVLDTVRVLEEALRERGWSCPTESPDARRSGILIASSGGDDGAMHRRLLDRGVRCSLRGGGIRFAPHYFTNSDDVRQVLDAIATLGT